MARRGCAGQGGATLLALAAALLPGVAQAAPFCVATQTVPPRCLYADPASCQAEAQREHGFCASNPDETLAQRGGGRFCVAVGGTALDCAYHDRGACERAAERGRSACVAAPATPQPGPPDPFSLRRPS